MLGVSPRASRADINPVIGSRLVTAGHARSNALALPPTGTWVPVLARVTALVDLARRAESLDVSVALVTQTARHRLFANTLSMR
jgi:hypothetical protein